MFQVMKKILFGLISLSFCIIAHSQNKISIIPEPMTVNALPGHFDWNSKVTVSYDRSDPSLDSTARWFANKVDRVAGTRLRSGHSSKRQVIYLKIRSAIPGISTGEGYVLDVTPHGIDISATSSAGIFYGLQSLLQLMPPQVESVNPAQVSTFMIPCVHIIDYPRFGWRGLMLDVSRHFFTKKEVEAYIDQMAKYKYNVFHWHLTDDNGWRIAIKGLPGLTDIGAWRVSRTGTWRSFAPPMPGEKADYGGYYTHEDIKEVIRYAQARHIMVLPEIDVPAHSLALISAYPSLSCTKLQYQPNPGVRYQIKEDNVLCPANDSVYMILDRIFTQVAQLFPCPYIHIGGDEAYKGFWANDTACQRLMKEMNIPTAEGLQSYFIHKMEDILTSKGKKMIGWDEILEGGLAPNATVMSWRGMKGGIEAAKMRHNVIMTPWDYAYLDLYQGDPLVEPYTYGRCRLTDCYRYEPVPDSVDPKYIIGGQGNLWTENVPNFRQAEYMTWPRALALAEVYWSPKSKRDWSRFVHEVPSQFKRLAAAEVKYATSLYDAESGATQNPVDSSISVELKTEMPGLQIYYTFDNTDPDSFSPQYTPGEMLSFPKGATNLKLITYESGLPVGKQINITEAELRTRAHAKKHIY
jgi:hexosaminidase